MLTAIGSLAALGVTLGTLLGVAARYTQVEGDPLEADLEALLPGSQCGQCGFAGCRQAAAALAQSKAPVTLCPPGGRSTALALADKLGLAVDLSSRAEAEPMVAFVREDLCIGCMRCFHECSSDAILGGPKQMHTVMAEFCHGCRKCSGVCPTEAIRMHPLPVTLVDWHWPKPDVRRAA